MPKPFSSDDYPDVPMHRPSVGAMGLGPVGVRSEYKAFKPYVYRGGGVDVLTEYSSPRPRPEPRRSSTSRGTPRRSSSRLDLLAVKRAARQAIREFSVREYQRRVAKMQPVRQRKAPPQWKPMTGADMETLLAEYAED